MMVTLNEDSCSFNDLQERLAADSERLGLQVKLQRQDVFDFMYKV